MKLAVCTASDGPVNVFLLTDVHVSVGVRDIRVFITLTVGGPNPCSRRCRISVGGRGGLCLVCPVTSCFILKSYPPDLLFPPCPVQSFSALFSDVLLMLLCPSCLPLLCNFLSQDFIKKITYSYFLSPVVRLGSSPSSSVWVQRVWGGQMELLSFLFVLLSQKIKVSFRAVMEADMAAASKLTPVFAGCT